VVSGWDLFAPRMFEELRRLSYIYGLTQPDVNQPFTAGKTYVVPAATGPMPGCWARQCCPISKLICFEEPRPGASFGVPACFGSGEEQS